MKREALIGTIFKINDTEYYITEYLGEGSNGVIYGVTQVRAAHSHSAARFTKVRSPFLEMNVLHYSFRIHEELYPAHPLKMSFATRLELLTDEMVQRMVAGGVCASAAVLDRQYDASIVGLALGAVGDLPSHGSPLTDYWRPFIHEIFLDEELLRRVQERLSDDVFSDVVTPFFRYFASRLEGLIRMRTDAEDDRPLCKNPLSNLYGLLAEDFIDQGETTFISRTPQFRSLVAPRDVQVFEELLRLLFRQALAVRDRIRRTKENVMVLGTTTYVVMPVDSNIKKSPEERRLQNDVALLDFGCTLVCRFACNAPWSNPRLLRSVYFLREQIRRFEVVDIESLEHGVQEAEPSIPFGRKTCCYCEQVSFEMVEYCSTCCHGNWWYG